MTKEERKEVYIKAFRGMNDPRNNDGLCWTIGRVINYDWSRMNMYIGPYMMQQFPEFAIFEPGDGRLWWFSDLDPDAKECRETILAFCIAMCD